VSEVFQYTVLQVVPSVERGERFNAAVVLYCRRGRFLRARTGLDESRLAVLGPALDPDEVRRHLDVLGQVAAGEGEHPVARLEQSERFHWLAAPSSTIVQPTPVHTGLTDDPAERLERLFGQLVAFP
jgi:hypothetical protein